MKEAITTLGEGTNYPLISMVGLGRRFVHFLKRRWWIPLITVALALGAQWLYTWYRPPAAMAVSRMLVGGRTRIPEGGLYTEEWQNFYGTQVELMQGEKIRRRALDRLQRLRQTQNESPVHLEVTQPRKTTIFVLQATGKDQTYTLNFLNALMDEYLAYRKEVRSLSSDDTLASLTAQYLEQEKELKRNQEGMLEFQRTNSVAFLQEEGSSDNLVKLTQELTDLKLQRALLAGATESLLSKAGATAAGAPTDASLAAPGITTDAKPRQALEMLKFQQDQLKPYLRPEHPKMVKLDLQIAQAEKLVGLYQTEDQEQLTNAQKSIDLKIKSVEGTVKELEVKMVEANRRLAEYSLLKENLDRVTSYNDHLRHLLENVGLDKNVDQETVVVMDQAAPAVAEKRLVQKALAGIIGLIVGLALVAFIAQQDDRITSLGELKLHFPEKLVGQIPDVARRRHAGALELLGSQDRRHVFAESYRTIRTSLMCMNPVQGRPRTILVTSAMPNEGKSTVTANLARSLAFAGSRVVLVDGDLRTGRLHEALGLPCEPGLNQLRNVEGGIKFQPMPTSVPNLFFTPRGAASLDCGELFVNPAIDRLLEELAANFDYVLIDSAPIFAASDTLSLASKVDGAIFVLRDSFTRTRLAREALGQLYQLEVPIMGIIFNRTNGSSTEYPYFKNSEYHLPA
jgi:succinoglycan biosynthesis transport protein ExoP